MSLQIFLSSMCYELRDLRAAVKDFLTELGIEPMLSNDAGFPRYHGLKPYVSCLKVLEECPMVIGIIDRKYGQKFHDWAPYNTYNGLSPTHAELRHTNNTKKKLLLYVHQDTMTLYEQWQKNRDHFNQSTLHNGMSLDTLLMVDQIKHYDPAPWLESFEDVSGILKSLKKVLVSEIYQSLMEQKKQNEDEAQYFLNKILELAPEVKRKVEEGISPELVRELSSLKIERSNLEEKYHEAGELSQKKINQLDKEKETLLLTIQQKEEEINASKMALFFAATKDVSWLSFIRTHLMDKQPGRVPFHNDQEVAIRGFHVGNMAGKIPLLKEVTWSKLQYTENKLHRGYYAGLIFNGNRFAPGITWASRKVGANSPPVGHSDYQWKPPNIYFGDYLEVSTCNDEFETPLNYISTEFCVRNPENIKSEWVKFSYSFNFEKLKQILDENESLGKRLFNESKFESAIEPLRKAMVYSDRLNGENDIKTIFLRDLWNKSIDNTSLSKMRFKVGDRVKIVSGEQIGKCAVINKLYLRSRKCYHAKEEKEGVDIFLADNEIELNNPQ